MQIPTVTLRKGSEEAVVNAGGAEEEAYRKNGYRKPRERNATREASTPAPSEAVSDSAEVEAN